MSGEITGAQGSGKQAEREVILKSASGKVEMNLSTGEFKLLR